MKKNPFQEELNSTDTLFEYTLTLNTADFLTPIISYYVSFCFKLNTHQSQSRRNQQLIIITCMAFGKRDVIQRIIEIISSMMFPLIQN